MNYFMNAKKLIEKIENTIQINHFIRNEFIEIIRTPISMDIYVRIVFTHINIYSFILAYKNATRNYVFKR
jgi:hypothetical protein